MFWELTQSRNGRTSAILHKVLQNFNFEISLRKLEYGYIFRNILSKFELLRRCFDRDLFLWKKLWMRIGGTMKQS